MVYTLRKVHHRFFMSVAVLLPLLMFTALGFKVSLAGAGERAAVKKRLLKGYTTVVHKSSYNTKKNEFLIRILSKSSNAKKYAFLIDPLNDPKQPDVLVYLGLPSKQGAPKGVLLGSLLGKHEQAFFVSKKKIEKKLRAEAPTIILYSQAFSRVVDQFRLKAE